MERIIRDLKDGIKALLRTPGFALVAVMTLGLGIGAAVTTFSVMQAVLWRPLPYPHADRLMMLNADLNARRKVGVAPLEEIEIENSSRTIDAVASLSGVNANLN